MQMADVGGLELARRIRQLPVPAANLPLVILTPSGWHDASEQNSLYSAHLTKPIKPSRLFNILVGLFSGQPVRFLPQQEKPQSVFDYNLGQRKPLRILLVEDYPANQKLALKLLERLGYGAEVAENGVQALGRMANESFDLIFMDQNMPEMDGLETTRRIRRREKELGLPPVHIIAMTANAIQGDREVCIAAGMDDYVSKPIRVEALLDAIGKVRPNKEATAPQPVLHPAQGEHSTSAPLRAAVNSDKALIDQAMIDQSMIDQNVLDELLEMGGGEREFLVEMINSYLVTAPELLAKLRTGVSTGDSTSVRLAAHTLKSGSQDMGARTLASLFAKLENLGYLGQLDGAAQLLAEVETLFPQVVAELEVTRHVHSPG